MRSFEAISILPVIAVFPIRISENLKLLSLSKITVLKRKSMFVVICHHGYTPNPLCGPFLESNKVIVPTFVIIMRTFVNPCFL